MGLFTIILFLIIMWGLGFTITRISKESEFIEKNVMRLGIGVSFFVVLGVFLNLVGIPLDWKLFLIISLIYPVVYLLRNRKISINLKPKIKKKSLYSVIVLLIFFFSLYMYAGGAFKYSYLEDDDPWEHAKSVKYVSMEKTVFDSPAYNFKFIDPYPPAYDMLMGVLHQTNDSVSWTLKFFNGLILALSILFFYFFANEFTGSSNKALFSTFVLASLPSFFTHFIWAHSLVIMFFFVALYSLEKLKDDKKWMYPAMFAIASVLLTQPSQAIKLSFMFLIYFLIKLIYYRDTAKRIFLAGTGGITLSLLWWFSKASTLLGSKVQKSITSTHPKYASLLSSVDTSTFLGKLRAVFPPQGGTATRAYSFGDFFVVQPFGGINVHIGWGIAITILLLLAFIFIALKFKNLSKQDKQWVSISVLWFIFTFLGVNALTFNLPIGFITFRFWLLLAVPVALLSSLGLQTVLGVLGKKQNRRIFAVVLIILFILVTSTYPKYNQNTLAAWPPGASWASNEELQTYTWLLTLPPNTKVFEPSIHRDKFVIGFDKFTCSWCESNLEIKSKIVNLSPAELNSWLKENEYEYMIFGASTRNDLAKDFSEAEADQFLANLIEAINSNEFFQFTYQTEGAIVLAVV